MNAAAVVFAFSLLTLSGFAAAQQPPAADPPPAVEVVSPKLPLRSTFEKDASGWVAYGPGTNLVNDPAAPGRPGAATAVGGALRFEYRVGGKNETSALALPVEAGTLSGAKAIRFSVRASGQATPLLVALQEKDGGRYVAVFTAPKDAWQVVELFPADFTLADDATDPADPNNRLDMDRVDGLLLTDLGQFTAQGAPPAMAALLGLAPPGPRTLHLADVVIGADPTLLSGSIPPPAPPPPGQRRPQPPRERSLDPAARPQIDWIALGGDLTMRRVNADRGRGKTDGDGDAPSPLGKTTGLRIDYTQAGNRAAALLRPVRRGDLPRRSGLTFSAAATRATTLMVQLEEKGGGKYAAAVYVPAGIGADAATPVSLPFADFAPADDSKDANNKLDLDQVKQLVILDVSGVKNPSLVAGPNTLYLGDLQAVR